MTELELELVDGWVERELAEEFPELRLLHTRLDVRPARTPPEVRERLRACSPTATPAGRSSTCARTRCRGPTASSRARSGIDPDQRPHARGGGRAAAAEARRPPQREHRRRRAHDRDRRDRRAADRARRRSASTGELGLRLARAGETLAARGRCRRASSWSPTSERPVAVVLGDVGEDAGVTPDDRAHGPLRPGREGRARGSASRRRCGPRPRRFTLTRVPDVLDRPIRGTAGSSSSASRSALTTPTSARRGARCSIRSPGSRASWRSVFCATWPRTDLPHPAVAGRGGGPRLLSLARARGAPRRAGDAGRGCPPRAVRPHLGRGAEPPPDRGDDARAGAPQVACASRHEDIGEPGCKHWHVRPRFGLVGMLMNWWRVVISSGCPLAT